MIPGFSDLPIEEFRGLMRNPTRRDVPVIYSPDCLNCAFEPGNVGSRPGTTSFLALVAGQEVLRMQALLVASNTYYLLLLKISGVVELWVSLDGAAATRLFSGVRATGTLTATGTFSNNETVTIDGTVYTFKAAIVSAFDVLIGGSAAASLDNLKAAINRAAGEGTLYGTGTTAHPTVTATTNTDTTQKIQAKTGGTGGNSIATTETCANASWGAGTLSGGVNLNANTIGFRTAAFGNLVIVTFHDGNFGVIEPHVWNPTTGTFDAATGGGAPTTAPVAADGGTGDVTIGAHRIAVWFRYRTGFESVRGPYVSYTATADDAIALSSIPTGDDDVEARVIGMTLAEDTETYYEVTTIEDNTTTTYTININDEQLQQQRDMSPNERFMTPLRNFGGCWHYHDRIVYWGDSTDPSLLWGSEPGLPVSVPGDSFLPIKREDGDRIANVFEVRGPMIVAKLRSLHAQDDNGDDFRLWPRSSQICNWLGTISYHGVSLSSDRTEAFILDFKGLYRFVGGAPELLSGNIQTLWNTVNYVQMTKAEVHHDPLNHTVYCLLPTGASTVTNAVWMMDYEEGYSKIKWSPWSPPSGVEWRSMTIDSRVLQNDGESELIIGTTDDGLVRLDYTATSDYNGGAGAVIEWYYQTGLIQIRDTGLMLLGGMTFYLEGSGDLQLRTYNQDGTLLAPSPANLSISASAGRDVLKQLNIRRERVFLRFGQNEAPMSTLTAYAKISRLTVHAKADGVRVA